MTRTFLLALQFLTIFPVTIRGDVSQKQMGGSALYFPVVGALQGLLLFLAARLLTTLFPISVSSGLIVALLLITSGGFHIDGLADSFDGMSVKSTGDMSRDRERRLAVMKDSTVGAIGAMAVVLSILLKYLFVEAVLQKSSWLGPYALLLMPIFSKWIMVPVLCHGMSARKEGLAALFIGHVNLPTLFGATLWLFLLFCLSTIGLSPLEPLTGLKVFLLTLLPFYALGLAWSRFCRWRFGGLTGDNLGAISEMSEPLFLASLFVLV